MIITSNQIKSHLKTMGVYIDEKDIDYYIKTYFPHIEKTNLYVNLSEEDYEKLIGRLVRKDYLKGGLL